MKQYKYINEIKEKLAPYENIIIDFTNFDLVGKTNEERDYYGGYCVDGWLMPNGDFIYNREIRHQLEISGHSNVAEFLLQGVNEIVDLNNPDYNSYAPMNALLKAGFIRFAIGKPMIINFRIEPTKEQYEFIERINFKNGINVEILEKPPGKNEIYEKPISGTAVVAALKDWYAKGAVGILDLEEYADSETPPGRISL